MPTPLPAAIPKPYSHAILGGTFDHLHAGHIQFISAAFAKSEMVTIGLTDDEFTKNKSFAYSIEPYADRKYALENFLTKNGWAKTASIQKINDPFGTSITDATIDAIFVTLHGLPNALLINEARKKKGLIELEIFTVPFLEGSDGKVISSTRIRRGEIDRMGNPYINIFDKTLLLPDNLRGEVKNTPSGDLLKNPDELKKFVKNAHLVLSAGDTTSTILENIERPSNIAIIDLKIKRRPISGSSIKADFEAENAPGEINHKAVYAINEAIEKALSESNQIIKIAGEEDLLTLPAVLLAPLDSHIIYGSPDKGAIGVTVTEEKKEEVRSLLLKFATKNE